MSPTLETPRLWLRAYRLADFDAYAAIFGEEAVMRFLGGKPLSREACWTRFVRQIGMWPAMGFGFFALESKATGALIGEAGFHDLKRELFPTTEGTLEAGWGLTAAMHGAGLASEAMRAALAWADAEKPDMRMTCIIHPENAASLNLAAKLDFAEFARASYHDGPVVVMERGRAAT